ncbi:MAG: hypothetical protein ACXWLG_10720 [Myxococcaceae bacterium]
MRLHLVAISLGVTLVAGAARAQCQDGGSLPDGGCGSPFTFTVTVAALPRITGVPLLDIDATIVDNGSIIPRGPAAGGTVFVTVRGPNPGGGGKLIQVDGGVDLNYVDTPFTAQLSLAVWGSDGGVLTTSIWDGGTSLFMGDNTIVVSAVEPTGVRADSAPQMVTLDLGLVTSDAGADGGTGADGGVTSDGGTGSDAGQSGDGGLTGPDAGAPAGGGGASTQGCSTTPAGAPSFLLMALAVMLAALGRHGMRG